MTTTTNFIKSRIAGKYTVEMTSLKTGNTLRLTVTKAEVMNGSARGGAYRMVWRGQFGDTKVMGDTRIEAFNLLVAALERKGIRLTEKV